MKVIVLLESDLVKILIGVIRQLLQDRKEKNE